MSTKTEACTKEGGLRQDGTRLSHLAPFDLLFALGSFLDTCLIGFHSDFKGCTHVTQAGWSMTPLLVALRVGAEGDLRESAPHGGTSHLWEWVFP